MVGTAVPKGKKRPTAEPGSDEFFRQKEEIEASKAATPAFLAQLRQSFEDPAFGKDPKAPEGNIGGRKSTGGAANKRASGTVAQSAKSSSKPKAKKGAAPTAALLVTDLPGNLQNIYKHTIERLATPQILKAEQVEKPTVIQDVGGATLAITVPSKAHAKKLFQRLQNANVYGRRWKCEFMPKSAIECVNVPSVIDIELSKPLSIGHVQHVMSSLPGFLTVFENADLEELRQQKLEKERKRGSAKKEAKKKDAEEENVNGVEGEAPEFVHFVATFADEGSALHSRAVVSGRQHEGAHFFVSRRPVLKVAEEEE